MAVKQQNDKTSDPNLSVDRMQDHFINIMAKVFFVRCKLVTRTSPSESLEEPAVSG